MSSQAAGAAPVVKPVTFMSPEAVARTAAIQTRLQPVVSAERWPLFAPDIDAILRLKKERNAVILAHNYQTPEIFHGVADIVGDSLALAREAAMVEADVIVLCGVHFMAETAKIINPEKTVLIPDLKAGCSLAESITAADVRLLRQKYPGVPVVTYVNTSADVKAESDICCTSGNAVKVVESLGVDRVIMLPDEFLAQNVQAQTKVKIIAWKGYCEVHELFTVADIEELRAKHHERQHRRAPPGDRVHPALPPVPAHEADHAAQDPRSAGAHAVRSDGRSGHCRPRPPCRRAHARGEVIALIRLQ